MKSTQIVISFSYTDHSNKQKQASGLTMDEPSSSQERESSQPPQAVMVNTSVENFTQEVPEMAHEWEFELDVFQKQAILHLEKKRNVFVSAHTSAGKTVVAEYAIALSRKHGTKAIYTSPIKALSNQKYRDFKNVFGSDYVGLQTGDVQLNESASCVIMTTEILRSKLYDQDLSDLECVIIDEVQYIGDKVRGVVWEEVLIMLPDTVKLVLLSATFWNTMEFANWIVKIKKQSVYVICTEKRPVPLHHYIYTGTQDFQENQLFEIVDGLGNFNNRNYRQAWAEYENQKRAGLRKVKQKNQYLPFVRILLHPLQYLPAIVFTFSRAKCRDNALTLQAVDLTERNEKSEIQVFLTTSLEALSDSNMQLVQIMELREMLERGIAYHHSGVLPRMKEIVEHLFQRGLVKVLFATETFASGVNMPARTVIFDSINEKFDGEKKRTVNSAEYIQMAGRAGRRGKDSCGFSIILCGDRVPKASILRSLQQGKPCPVESQFHLKDTMILNLLNRAKFGVQDILRKSFAEYSRDSTEKELLALKQKLNDMEPVPCDLCKEDLEQYYDTCKRIHTLRSDLQSESIMDPEALPIGRIVVVNSEKHKNHFGIIISNVNTDSNMVKAVVICSKKASTGEPKTELKVPMILKTEVFLPTSDFSHCSEVVEFDTDDFTITNLVVAIPEELAQSSVSSTMLTKKVVQMMCRLRTKDIPLFIPQTVSQEFIFKFKEREDLEKQIFGYKCLQCKHLTKHYEIVENQKILEEKIAEVEEQLSQRHLLLLPQFEQRQKVFKHIVFKK
ncbi:helicase SKI2W-like [Anneissia japonica]|uniref:helicase SKI2W-like n=1 Tax=Anneissia japonica TaxID=1529436 RepID=UPI001425A734|nr:helicase SKI2W-like [Anneissia japonica]